MKSKLWYLMTVSLKRKIKTKWFLIANLLLAILIVGIINIDSIITFFGGDFEKFQRIYIIDNTDYSYDLVKEQLVNTEKAFNGNEKESLYKIKKYDKDIEEAKKEIEKDKEIIFILINSDENNIIRASIMSDTLIDTMDYQIIMTSLNNVKTSLVISSLGLTNDEINQIYSDVEIERIILDEDKKSTDEAMEMITTTVFPIVILPFFMLSLFLVQMIGAEVNDEKTTRGMEIIISNVSPKAHFFAKVIAGNLFVLFQGVLLLIYAGIGILIRYLLHGAIFSGYGSEIGSMLNSFLGFSFVDKLLYIIPLTLISMILTFIAYSLLAGILASVTTNTEDFQQLQTPIIIVSLVGYYLSMMAGVFDGALFIRILSYVPLLSAILSPSLLMLGQIGVVDMVISIIILIFTNFLLIKYGLRIYKVGILNYSSKDLWKKMFKAMKGN